MKKRHAAIIGVIVLLAGVIRAHAATITLPGDSVIFALDDTQLGLFGEPLVFDDTLYFLPTAFVAKAENNDGIRTTNDTTRILVTAKAGFTLKAVDLVEEGIYRRVVEKGGGPAEVSVSGQLRARNMENPVTTVDDDIGSPTIFEPTGFNAAPEDWVATAGVDLSDWESMEVDVTLSDMLNAYTLNLGNLAYIEKKYVGLTVMVAAIPLPSAFVLFGFGLFSLLLTRRIHRY